MGRLVVEFLDEGQWLQLGLLLYKGDIPGSFAHESAEGQQMYVFSCAGGESHINRSETGVALDIGSGDIATEGLERLATLTSEGPAYECDIQTGRMPKPLRIRFRHEKSPARA